jgi:galactarate dehydratase
MAPVIKVSSRTTLSQRWFDLIDLDAGTIATGDATIEEVGEALFHKILDVASGRTKTAADTLGLANDMVVFNPAPIT